MLVNNQIIDCKTGAITVETLEVDASRFIPPDTRIAESKAYLQATDYKMLPDYTVAPDGEPLESVRAKRAAARELIRTLQ